jgi:cell wall-associated NlpC family hydrolase
VLATAALAACSDTRVGTAASHLASRPAPVVPGERSNGSRTAPAASRTARAAAGTIAGRGANAGQGAVAGKGAIREVADPQEAQSFPAPATVQHAAAAAPRKAGEAVVAAGAPSDAEVRAELSQMQAVERSARQAQRRRLTPVAGGQSIGGNGTLPIPADVPEAVQKVVAGANEIADFPYVFGGGHASFVDNAYDCSGSVSYALAAGGLLSAPETSGELESWGVPGPGRYITVFANAGHTYMYVDGVLYDTAGRSGVYASRWLVGAVDNTGFVARHWPGL